MEVFGDNLKLNVGCGGKFVEGWIGVDVVPRPAARIVAPAHAIPLPDGCAAAIMAIHVFEHFYRWECDTVLDEWHRLLKPGGKLIMEMPDLEKFCQNIVDGRTGKHVDQLGLWGMYGDPTTKDPAMTHRWAWCFKSIKPLLEEHGFRDCVEEETQFHHAGRKYRDFRIVCRRR